MPAAMNGPVVCLPGLYSYRGRYVMLRLTESLMLIIYNIHCNAETEVALKEWSIACSFIYYLGSFDIAE